MDAPSTIELRFVKGGGFSSRAIMWFSSGEFSHVDYVMRDGQLLGSRSDHIANVEPGVQIRPVRYTDNEPAAVFTLEVHEQDKRDYEDFLLAQLGKPYDSAGIVGFIWGRNWREDGSWFCSELQMAALAKCVLRREVCTISSKVTPSALALVMSVLGAPVKRYPQG